jgi:hypothetical protein
MLESITLETFRPRVGETFRLDLDGQAALDFVLESALEAPVTGWQPPGAVEARRPFSLVFVGPPTVVLPQRIYRLEHDRLGTLEIFIVPVGRTAEGVRYEAVFS